LLTVGRTANFGKLESGIEGISRGACQLFLTNAPFRENYPTGGPVMVWLNLNSKEEVDELNRRWEQARLKDCFRAGE
jgi:hypothetical protein